MKLVQDVLDETPTEGRKTVGQRYSFYSKNSEKIYSYFSSETVSRGLGFDFSGECQESSAEAAEDYVRIVELIRFAFIEIERYVTMTTFFTNSVTAIAELINAAATTYAGIFKALLGVFSKGAN